MVPAGCRSPGHCFGNHSRQPDGISVGEREKDGSGSLLPGPARAQKLPVEESSGSSGGLCGNVWSETNRRRLAEIFCLIGGARVAKKDSQGRRRSLKTKKKPKKPSHLIFTFDKLLSASLRPVTFIPAAVFSVTATSHSKTVCRLFVATPHPPSRLSVLRI